MKIKPLLCVSLLYYFTTNASEYITPSSAITWEANGGRFGDNLMSYARAKWLSYLYKIPLLYVPFDYSDQLIMHEEETVYMPESAKSFSEINYLPLKMAFTINPHNNTLYINQWSTTVEVNWHNKAFIDDLKKNISPRHPIKKMPIPKGCISVAVHVRKGGSFDNQKERDRCPLRFVSDEFFIDQIARIADMFPNQRLYIYIFTDDQNPKDLKKKFKKALKNPLLTFDYQRAKNNHYSNVLEDFFAMMNFHCIIRPKSHFSLFAQRLGNSKIAIYPQSIHRTSNGKLTIGTINISTRASLNDKWNTKKLSLIS